MTKIWQSLRSVFQSRKTDIVLTQEPEKTYGVFYKASSETPFEFISFSIGKNNSVIVNLKNVKTNKVYKIPKEMFDAIFVRITK